MAVLYLLDVISLLAVIIVVIKELILWLCFQRLARGWVEVISDCVVELTGDR